MYFYHYLKKLLICQIYIFLCVKFVTNHVFFLKECVLFDFTVHDALNKYKYFIKFMWFYLNQDKKKPTGLPRDCFLRIILYIITYIRQHISFGLFEKLFIWSTSLFQKSNTLAWSYKKCTFLLNIDDFKTPWKFKDEKNFFKQNSWIDIFH